MQRCMPVLMFLFAGALWLHGQTGVDDPPVNAPVPLVVRFSSNMRELDGTAPSGLRSITFALYKDQNGGAPLWLETQTVSLDNQGRFTVLLGSSSTLGVPAATFVAGEPRWIGITPDDGVERPRLELVSVPYAFKAADADTLGGKRSDEFVSLQQLSSLLATPQLPSGLSTAWSPTPIESESLVPHLNADLLHGFPDSAFAKLNESNVFPQPQFFPGGIDMTASNPEANAPNLLDSAPLDFESSSQDSQINSLVKQRFRWVSQSLPGATNGPTARLSLFFGANGATPSSTGLFINSDGTINFAPGQQLPTGVVSGGGVTGTGPGGTSTPVVNTAPYSWNEIPPHATALQVGTNTVTLTPCPRGVNGTDVWHYLYVSVTGTPEVVLITGGTCTSGARSGTIEFAANYPHPIGYSIGSATDGVQEAVIVADVPNTNGQISRQVLIDPGSHLFRARLSIRSSGMTVTSSGATITCAMSDTCIMLGDPANANIFSSIVLQGLRLAAGVKSGTWPAIEDNANGTSINDFAPATSPIPGASFGSLIQIDNDQAATVNNLNANPSANWGKCDTTFCSTTVVGPGPFSKNAGVLWVQNSNLSLQCVANGIDNQNGNTVHVSNSVVQGYAQFGIRARTVYNPITIQLDSVYFEEDGYCNPLGTGSSGLIVEGGKAFSTASNPAGLPPVFTNTGTTQYFYYIVVHSSTMGTSPAYLAGYANTNGSGRIRVLWDQIGTADVITYDVLRIVGQVGSPSTSSPYGTGPFAVATGVPATRCSNKVCSIDDDAESSPSSYTVSDVTTYWPALTLWPGTIILTTPSDYQNTGGGVPTQYFADSITGGGIVASAGASQPSVFAQQCDPQSNWSSIWMQCVAGNAASNDYPPVVATVLQQSVNGGAPGGLKGRLIFEMPPVSSVPHTHVITLADSNPDKTMATPDNRPSWDANDTYIGFDQPQNVFVQQTQLSVGAPVSISQYIANPGDGVNYLERLTAAAKVFNVPVQMTQIRTGTLANTDAAGVLVISGGTAASYTFTGTYNSPLSCGLTPLSDPTETGVYWASITNATLTVNVKVPGNVSFSYQCWGRQ